MSGHCGCQGFDAALGELRGEHTVLLERTHGVRRAVAAGDRPAAVSRLAGLVGLLARHVAREERGVFAALREHGDLAGEVDALEGEHLALDSAISSLDPQGVDFEARVLGLLEELEEHIEREDLGILPACVVTLGAAGWATVDRAHHDLPTFLDDRTMA